MTDSEPQQLYPSDIGSDYDRTLSVIKKVLAFVRTATLVQVKAVINKGELKEVGTVDVLPLVRMQDGVGNVSDHVVVYGLPYLRLQGGKKAIIIDPQVDDVGIAVFCDRDISSVKKTKAMASPGSRRQFSFPDGLYLGGVLNGTPEQYIRYYDKGIDIVDKNNNKINMQENGIKITDKNNNVIDMKNGSIAITGNLTVTGFIKAGFGGGDTVSVQTHTHPGIQSGPSSTGAPTPGT